MATPEELSDLANEVQGRLNTANEFICASKVLDTLHDVILESTTSFRLYMSDTELKIQRTAPDGISRETLYADTRYPVNQVCVIVRMLLGEHLAMARDEVAVSGERQIRVLLAEPPPEQEAERTPRKVRIKEEPDDGDRNAAGDAGTGARAVE